MSYRRPRTAIHNQITIEALQAHLQTIHPGLLLEIKPLAGYVVSFQFVGVGYWRSVQILDIVGARHLYRFLQRYVAAVQAAPEIDESYVRTDAPATKHMVFLRAGAYIESASVPGWDDPINPKSLHPGSIRVTQRLRKERGASANTPTRDLYRS